MAAAAHSRYDPRVRLPYANFKEVKIALEEAQAVCLALPKTKNTLRDIESIFLALEKASDLSLNHVPYNQLPPVQVKHFRGK